MLEELTASFASIHFKVISKLASKRYSVGVKLYQEKGFFVDALILAKLLKVPCSGVYEGIQKSHESKNSLISEKASHALN